MVRNLFFLLCLFFLAGTALGASQSEELKTVRENIKRAEASLKEAEKEKKGLLPLVRIAEERVADADRASYLVKRELEANTRRISVLTAQKKMLEASVSASEKDLSALLLFRLEEGEAITAKALFAGDNSSAQDALRAMEISEGLSVSVARIYAEFAALLTELEKNEAELIKENEELKSRKKEAEELAASYTAAKNDLDKRYQAIKQDEREKRRYISSQEMRGRFIEERIKKAGGAAAKNTVAELKALAKMKGSFAFPMRGVVVQEFGTMLHKATGAKIPHKGIRIRPQGEDAWVKSAADGTVDFVSYVNGWQNIIIIKHDKNLYTVYANIDEFFVNDNQRVKRGETIGRLEGEYLYFEMRLGTRAVDPLTLL